MGANLVNTIAEAIAPRLGELTGGRVGLRILSNLAEHRKVAVRCRVPFASLRGGGFEAEDVAERIARAGEFAERDPFRAATHNKGVMNGIDPVVIATGNDWRAVEAGAHAWAARSGRYAPLSRWSVQGGFLCGELELPLATTIRFATLMCEDESSHWHERARFAL
jgi:hydroxymethylglutaryl-CoA reductase